MYGQNEANDPGLRLTCFDFNFLFPDKFGVSVTLCKRDKMSNLLLTDCGVCAPFTIFLYKSPFEGNSWYMTHRNLPSLVNSEISGFNDTFFSLSPQNK